MRVLVVDDDPASRHILAAQLAGVADCVPCGSGAEAVDAVKAAIAVDTPFDVVFLDIIMPHMDGHETLNHIRLAEQEGGLPPAIQVRAVMVTSMDDEANTMAALFDGQVSSYLTKPPNKAELLHKLETLGLL